MSEKLGEKVRRLKIERGYGTRELARMADVSEETVQKIESGSNCNPTLATLGKIAGALGVGVTDLLEEA